MDESAFIKQLRRAVAKSKARQYTVQEILACGCCPMTHHCEHCDGLRQANAKREVADRLLREPSNVERLLEIIDRRERAEHTA